MSGTGPEEPVAHDLTGSALHDDVFFLLTRLASIGASTTSRRLRRLDLRARHYAVLALACGDGDVTQRDLSRLLVLDPSQVVSLVDDLERRGLVKRRTDPRDRRSNTIVATPAGEDATRRAKELVDATADDLLRGLDDDERAQLLRLVRRASLGPAVVELEARRRTDA